MQKADTEDFLHHLFAGRFKPAFAAAQQRLKQSPGHTDAALTLAAIAIEHGNLAGGEKLLGFIGDKTAWYYALSARVALAKQQQEEARQQAQRAAEIGTANPYIANQIGVVLSRTGLHEQSLPLFAQAASGAPEVPDHRYNHAVALQFGGELAAAQREFEALVSLAPDHAQGWLALVQLADGPDVEWKGKLEALFAKADTSDSELLVGHALARLCENEKRWDEALKWLDKAKAKKSREIAHDRPVTERLFAAAKASASSLPGGPAEPAEGPIFVTGLPRSGTTLVERIISSHPRVKALGELSDFGIALKHHVPVEGQHVLEPNLLDAAAAEPDLSEVGQAYLDRISSLADGAERPLDKMPFNIFYAPAILRALPGARVICLRRSPFDVLFANYRQLFATGFSYYSYAYDFADAAHFVAQFESMADHFDEHLPQDRFTSVHYEKVIADQRGETERILAFCGLEWDDACLDFHRNQQPVATASSVQVRSPIYSSSVGKWRRYSEGSERAVAEFAKYGITPRDES